eukprot:365907-Chlamydomonas_euryale.AAC.25
MDSWQPGVARCGLDYHVWPGVFLRHGCTLRTWIRHPTNFGQSRFGHPAVTTPQCEKLSASGQEIGGDLVFGRRIGFSGKAPCMPSERLVGHLSILYSAEAEAEAEPYRVEQGSPCASQRIWKPCLLDFGIQGLGYPSENSGEGGGGGVGCVHTPSEQQASPWNEYMLRGRLRIGYVLRRACAEWVRAEAGVCGVGAERMRSCTSI